MKDEKMKMTEKRDFVMIVCFSCLVVTILETKVFRPIN